MNIELSSSEWKKDSTSPGLGKQQQVKNIRTNKAILKALEKMGIGNDEYDKLFVLGVDWIRQNGYMTGVRRVDRAYCAYHMGDMMVPPTLNNLKDFKSMLDLLYQYKHYLLYMAKIVEPAFYQEAAKKKLYSYQLPPSPKRSCSPDTLFTPVKKKTQRTDANDNEHDSTSDVDDYN
ncbi:hypothetical protein BDC45DRAFT_567169 [Circinella umbellata]|nr:hypothetical protein BDC45DRAFT_567169 [Circinella umbellata]